MIRKDVEGKDSGLQWKLIGGTEKTTKKLNKVSRSLGRDSNRTLPEYLSTALPLHPPARKVKGGATLPCKDKQSGAEYNTYSRSDC
jgi:hypothetical protein